MPAFIDLSGQTFGRLTAIRRVGTNSWGNAVWLCECSCGTECEVAAAGLRGGKSRSCGCLKRDVTVKRNKELFSTHGYKGTRIYRIWVDLRNRYYDGEKVSVCERWEYSFENFLEDMGEPPSIDHSIDRIDGAKGYSPSNCRWANFAQQNNNRGDYNVRITAWGKTYTLSEWAHLMDLSWHVLYNRVRRNWDIERALSTPARSYRSKS